MPVEIIVAPGHSRTRSIGWLATRWIEHFCVHGPGDIQGRPLGLGRAPDAVPLSDELTSLTVDTYALAGDGSRLYDSVFYSRAKGCDKSGQAARIGLFEALGPCRFAGWAEGGEVYEWMDFRYVYAPGEPLGRVVTYPFLRVLATEEGQTGNVYDAMHYNLKEGPLREAFPRQDDVGLTRVFLPDGGEIRPSTASSSAKDGGKETWVNYDETHLYVLPELRRMYATVRRNLAKRKDAEPWSFETSTMYEPGRDSVAERSHMLAGKIRDGEVRRPRMLFNHREAPRDVELDDDDAVLAALKEAYGDADYLPFDRLLAEVRDPRNELADSVRYFFNQSHASARQAFDVALWTSLADSTYRVSPDALITLGFDGARRRDSTALVGTEVATGFQWTLGVWARPEDAEEWSVDEGDVDNVLAEAMRTYSVWRLYADPPYWETALARWAGEYGDKVVIEWHTNRFRQMAVSLRAYSNAMRDGHLSHDGDRRLAAAIANACRREMNFYDDEGRPLWIIEKDRPGSPLKIDPAMAACLSWQARLDAIASGATAPRTVQAFWVND